VLLEVNRDKEHDHTPSRSPPLNTVMTAQATKFKIIKLKSTFEELLGPTHYTVQLHAPRSVGELPPAELHSLFNVLEERYGVIIHLQHAGGEVWRCHLPPAGTPQVLLEYAFLITVRGNSMTIMV